LSGAGHRRSEGPEVISATRQRCRTPTVLLMRHAKADRPPGVPDRARPLADRGRTDALAVGAALAGLGSVPTTAVSSPARRALETTEQVLIGAGWTVPMQVIESLYGGRVEDVLAVIRSSEAETLLIVGHQPSWSQSVAALTGGAVYMPTAAVAAIAVSDRGQPQGSGSLLWLITPRLIEGGARA